MNEKLSESGARRFIETLDLANVLTEPLIGSIENLLRISAAEINSEEASVLIRDGGDGDLRFLSVIGQVADKLINLKVPAGKGIAGFVMSSGQPMAVADVGEEASFYAEVDRTTGYSTQIILATPLRFNGEMIGVLEYVNRTGAPPYAPFTPREMDQAAFFAEAIAPILNAYESAKLFRELGDKLISGESGIAELRKWLNELRDSVEHREMLELALLVRETARRGDAERALCRELLETVLRYSHNTDQTSFLG